MTKLSDTQVLILSNAAQRDGNIALPLPESLRGGAAKKVVGALLAKGFLATARASSDADAQVWGHDDEDWPLTLVATAAGLEAIGVEPEGASQGATGAPGEDAATTDADGDEAAPGAPADADGAEAPKTPKTRAGTKQAQMIEMLRAPEGATIAEIAEATGWQPHTVRGAIAGALKKRLGLNVVSEKVEPRGRVYRIKA